MYFISFAVVNRIDFFIREEYNQELIKALIKKPQESRKEWLEWMFEQAGKKKSKVTNMLDK
ncbi:MAG: hypothetical protein ABI472_08500 [Ginsengibacter sp.]